jgi:hypothetical protein
MEVNSPSEIFFDSEGRIDFAEGYLRFKEHMQAISIATDDTLEQLPPLHPAAKRFSDCLWLMTRRRRFFVTQSGRIGLGPSETQVGDILVVIFYCPTPIFIAAK